MSDSNNNDDVADAFEVLSSRIDSIQEGQLFLNGKVDQLTKMFEEFIKRSSSNNNTNSSPTLSDSKIDQEFDTSSPKPSSKEKSNVINSKTPFNVKNLRFKSKGDLLNNVRRQSFSQRKMEENEERILLQDQIVSRSVKIPAFEIPIINNFLSVAYIRDILEKAERYEELYKVSSNLGQKIEKNLCDSIPALLHNTTCNGVIGDTLHLTGNKIFSAPLSTIYNIFQYLLEAKDKQDFLFKFKKGLESKSIEFPKNSLVTPMNYVNKLYPQVLGYLKQVQSLLDFLITDTLNYDILPALDKPSPSKIPGNPDNLLFIIFQKVPDNLFTNVYYNHNMSNVKFHKVIDGVVVVDPDDYKDFFKQFIIPFNSYLQICTDMNTFNRMFSGSSHEEKKRNVLKIGINNYSKLSNLLDGNINVDDDIVDDVDLEEKAQILSYVMESLTDQYNLEDTRDAYTFISNLNIKGNTLLTKDLSKIPCYNIVRGKQCDKYVKGSCKFGGHDGKLQDLVLSKRKEEFNLYKQLLNNSNTSSVLPPKATSREAMNAKDEHSNYKKLNNLLIDPDSVDTDTDYISMVQKEVESFLGSLNVNVDNIRLDLLKRIIVKCITYIDGVQFIFNLLIDTGNFSYPIIYKSAFQDLIDQKLHIPFKTSIFSHGLPDGTGLSTEQSLTLMGILEHKSITYKGSITFQVYNDSDKPIKSPFNAIVGLGSFLSGGSELRKFSSCLLRDLADFIDSNSEKLSYIEYIDPDTGTLQYITNALSLNSMVETQFLPKVNTIEDRFVYDADNIPPQHHEIVEDESVVTEDSSTPISN